MANDTSNDRYWLLDTAAEIISQGTTIKVRKLILEPAAQNDAATIQEYAAFPAALDQAAYIKELSATLEMRELDFPEGRAFNGFKLSALTAGAKLHVYLK